MQARATLEIPSPAELTPAGRRTIASHLRRLASFPTFPLQTVRSGKNRTKPAKTFKDYGRGFYLNVTRPELQTDAVMTWLQDQADSLLEHGHQYNGAYTARLYWA